MLDLYLILLFIFVSSCVYVYVSREHLTVEKRVDKLEDEYKKLKTTLETQEKRMGAASSQAANAKASLDLIRT